MLKIGKNYEIYYNGVKTPQNYAGVALLYKIQKSVRGEEWTDYFLEFYEWYPFKDLEGNVTQFRNSIEYYDRSSWRGKCLFPISLHQLVLE